MRWIVDEVDGLVASGVISAECGAALRNHYEPQLAQEESGGRVVLLSVLGATLIGAGIILIIAHNWDNLGRPARTALSLLPLLVGIALSMWTLLKRATSTAWREGAGVAHCAGVAASIALVSQTYHISGKLSEFLCTWLRLTLPIPYLLRAGIPAIVYLAGSAVWAGTSFELLGENHGAPGYWLFLAGILPFYASVVREDRLGKWTAWLSAALGISMAFGLECTNLRGLWIPAVSSLFGVLYLVGVMVFPERRYNPLRVLGALGVGYLSVMLTFKNVWPHRALVWTGVHWSGCILAAGLSCASLALLLGAIRRREDFNRWVAIFPLMALLACGVERALMQAPDTKIVTITLILSLYAFALALGTAFRGLQQRAFATLNGGLLILAALIIARFVDSEFSIVARGIAFVLLGILMLGANFWMIKAKREGNS